jgi:hypothetical protein
MERDAEHLRLLALFHYVVAGLTAAGSFLPLFVDWSSYLGDLGSLGNEPEVQAILSLFRVMVWLIVLMNVLFAAGLALVGWFLARRRHRLFCIVMAACNCLMIPLGTVLGIFTIVVLSRDSVKALFQPPAAPPAPAPDAGRV